MSINPSIFKAYDIRGIYPDQYNEQNIASIVKAIYTLYTQDLGKLRLKAVIGHDMRTSSPALYKIACEAITELGGDVEAIGLVSTPTMYYAAVKLGADFGMSINASHNPKEWNGLKFGKIVNGKMIKVSDKWPTSKILEVINQGVILDASPTKGTINYRENIIDEEVDTIIKTTNLKINKPLKIVMDPANGMGCINVKKFLQKIGIEPIVINDGLDGTFPNHQADPLQFELYKKLGEEVVSQKAHVGLAPDGDADRIFFVDEKGAMIPATYVTSLVSREILKKKPGRNITVDVRYIYNASRNIEKFGGKATYTRVGHAFITAHVNATNSPFGGESSGHFFFEECGGAESSLLTLAYVLEVMQVEDKTLSQIITDLKQAEESGEFNYVIPATTTGQQMIDEIAKKLTGAKLDYTDGISINYADWRANIRLANTEPLLRLNVEANTQEVLSKSLKEMQDLILSFGCKPKLSH